MNNWVPKNKTVIFFIISAFFSVMLYFAGLFIVFSKIRAIENLYHDTNSELFKEEKFWAVKSMAEANKELIQTLRYFFIQKGDEVQFIEKIEETARISSVKFEIASIDVKVNQEDLLKEDINIKMKIAGPWKNVIYFIDKLKKIPFGVLIEKVDLDADSSGNWSGSIEFIIFREK